VCQTWVTNSAGLGRGFFGRCGSRILRGGGVSFWLSDAGIGQRCWAGFQVELGLRQAEAARGGGFEFKALRTGLRYALHLNGDGFREFEAEGGLGGQDNLLIPGITGC
jgi:hypothetical protein